MRALPLLNGEQQYQSFNCGPARSQFEIYNELAIADTREVAGNRQVERIIPGDPLPFHGIIAQAMLRQGLPKLAQGLHP
jgi:hypothetical protein